MYEQVGLYDHSSWRSTLIAAADDAKNGNTPDHTGHTKTQENVLALVDALSAEKKYRWNQKKIYLLDYKEDASGKKITLSFSIVYGERDMDANTEVVDKHYTFVL